MPYNTLNPHRRKPQGLQGSYACGDMLPYGPTREMQEGDKAQDLHSGCDAWGSPRKHGRTCLRDTYRQEIVDFQGYRALYDTTPGAPVQPEARVCMLLFIGVADKGRFIEK